MKESLDGTVKTLNFFDTGLLFTDAVAAELQSLIDGAFGSEDKPYLRRRQSDV
jgi:hypothetical protein